MSEEHLHPDELNFVETRAQTEHKLEIMRRYFGQYAAIIAQSHSTRIDNRHIWLIDLFAGAGLHRSADHPDGQREGTALLACTHAWSVQRRFPNSRVHVRLVDLDPEYCRKLEARVQRFIQTPTLDEQVDVRVMPMDFASAIGPIVDEIHATGERVCSLWFIDPHEPTPLRFHTLRPIIALPHSELIINLDVTGIARMRGQVLSTRARQRVAESVRLSAQHLTEIYHSENWREPRAHVHAQPNMNDYDFLAEAYADAFRTYRFRHAYRLDASDNQYRYLVHLSRSPIAEAAFRESYEASNRRGLQKGRALSDKECATYANMLIGLYHDNETSVDDIYAAGVVPLDRGQINRVLNYAEQREYGRVKNGTMQWFSTRKPIEKLSPHYPRQLEGQLGLFDPSERRTDER